jgi:hypothetical protein
MCTQNQNIPANGRLSFTFWLTNDKLGNNVSQSRRHPSTLKPYVVVLMHTHTQTQTHTHTDHHDGGGLHGLSRRAAGALHRLAILQSGACGGYVVGLQYVPVLRVRLGGGRRPWCGGGCGSRACVNVCMDVYVPRMHTRLVVSTDNSPSVCTLYHVSGAQEPVGHHCIMTPVSTSQTLLHPAPQHF